jgi:hypothetical protein
MMRRSRLTKRGDGSILQFTLKYKAEYGIDPDRNEFSFQVDLYAPEFNYDDFQ